MRSRFTYLIIFIVLVSCSGQKRLSNQNLAYQYTQGLNLVHPYYRVYNISPDTSRLFFHIDPDELLFVSDDSLYQFKSSFSVSYKLLSGYESKAWLDSATRFYEYEKRNNNDFIIQDHIDIRAPDSADYILQVTLSDLNRQQAFTDFITVRRVGLQPANDFILFDSKWNRPLIKEYIDEPASVTLHTYNKSRSKIYLRYFKNTYPLSPPPFSSSELKPLSYSAHETRLLDLAESDKFLLEKPGIYHFQFDTMIKSAFTFFYFEEDYPNLTSTESLIESIRYLTTRQEFDKIMNSSNKKEAVDSFWLTMAGSRERGRTLIRSYYSRVQMANKLFTSYMEGWKTDRGLIYIIFGSPVSVYRNEKSESWNYSQSSFHGSLSFTFEKLYNPFTDNDYKLRRSHYYEIPWYKAVDSWRDGRVVNNND